MIVKTLLNAKAFVAMVALFFLSVSAHAQTAQPPDPPAGFDKIEQMVPVRDGVKLHTIIYAPKSHRDALPILFNRTPYGIDNIYRAFPGGSLKEEIEEGYIFAFQDIRGRFKSEGQFVMQRSPRESGKGIDEGTDAYDTIDWLVKNVPNNNGNVGIWGISYPGYYTSASIIDSHPALKAASPQAPI